MGSGDLTTKGAGPGSVGLTQIYRHASTLRLTISECGGLTFLTRKKTPGHFNGKTRSLPETLAAQNGPHPPEGRKRLLHSMPSHLSRGLW